MLIVLLTACSGSKEEQQDAKNSPDSAEAAESTSNQSANASEEPKTEPEPSPLTVKVETTIALRADRRVTVSGETNLPDATQVNIVVEREQSSVRWRKRTQVEDGRFRVGPLGPGSGLPDGVYHLGVASMEASVQPLQVRQRIGSEGEYLAGEWVTQSRHGLGQVMEYSRRVVIGSESRRTRDDVDVLTYPSDAS
ncbi:hypothetical protein [Halomonas llamarensis]|uniref:Uncharacterized protein n=1 Tax=Halomonas llamarensis TaxID=2945104 RepID=A0ABT0STS0_9GAMM|nr:hypothetical protein [Halomonas llamarensis]MCL7930973.1 hypothetical protein [Halomonas llamarensis]